MKKTLLLFTLLISIQVTCLFAQKYSSIDSVPGAPVFSYTQDSVIDLVKDKQFIKENAKIYIDFLSKTLSQHLLTGSADTLYLIQNLEQSNIILGNYRAAAKNLDTYLAKYPDYLVDFLPDKVFLDVKTGRKASYSIAILNEVKSHYDRKLIEGYGYGQDMLHKNPTFISQTAFGFLFRDTADFRKNFNAIKSLHTKLKKLSMVQMGDLLWVYGANIIADAVVNDFINTDPLHLEKWAKIWNSKLYHFTKKDSLHDVLACNYGAIYRAIFDPKILWNNPGEIPGNHIDDDNNGIVDDVHGYEYKINNLKIKEPVALSWEETDTITVLKEPYDTTRFAGAVQAYNYGLAHGSMSVELMLKGNPSVHFMVLNQRQYESKYFSSLLTGDIVYNQHVVDSLVDILISSFQEMAAYCNRYKVRVVQINSIGFYNLNVLHFKKCGRDSAEAEAFAKKMQTKFKNGYAIAYGEAPNTLFINSAGNDNIDIGIDSTHDLINFLHPPNMILAGALYKDLHKASYSNYGNRVDVFAPAHFPLRFVKFKYRWGQNSESSGTSASAPVVANLAIQILELNPNLTAEQVKQLIINGADKEPYEKGINIIDPKKTIALLKKGF